MLPCQGVPAVCAESSPYLSPPGPFVVFCTTALVVSTGAWDTWLPGDFPSQYSALVAFHMAQTDSAIPRGSLWEFSQVLQGTSPSHVQKEASMP